MSPRVETASELGLAMYAVSRSVRRTVAKGVRANVLSACAGVGLSAFAHAAKSTTVARRRKPSALCTRALAWAKRTTLFGDSLGEIDLEQALIGHILFVCEHAQLFEHRLRQT